MASTKETSTPTHYETLAERLRAKRQSDEQEVEQILNEHVDSLRRRSNSVLAEIERSLESIQDKTVSRISKSVLPLALIWTAAATGILLALGATWYASSLTTEIEHRHAKLNSIPDLHIKTCDGQTCVKIKPRTGKYGPNKKYRIIQQ